MCLLAGSSQLRELVISRSPKKFQCEETHLSIVPYVSTSAISFFVLSPFTLSLCENLFHTIRERRCGRRLCRSSQPDPTSNASSMKSSSLSKAQSSELESSIPLDALPSITSDGTTTPASTVTQPLPIGTDSSLSDGELLRRERAIVLPPVDRGIQA